MSIEKKTDVQKIFDGVAIHLKSRDNTGLAAAIGVNYNTLMKWKQRGKIGDIGPFVDACPDISVQWLRTGEGPMFRAQGFGITRREVPSAKLDLPGWNNVEATPNLTRSVPLISSVQAGAWTGIVDQFQPGDAEEWVPVSMSVGKNAFALRVSGTSMEPDYRPGDIIVVDPDTQAYGGSLVVVRLNSDDEATFKKLVFDGAKTYLEPLNPRYQPMDITGKDYTICGVVRQMLRDV